VLGTALGGISLGMVAQEMVATAAASDRMRNSMASTMGDAAAGGRELAFVRQEAVRLGLDLQSTTFEYTKLAAAARGTALEGQATRDIFTAVSTAATVMGMSAEQTGGALNAIQQMMSKGTVASEELRGQLGERLPGAFNIAARAMSVTTMELSKMLENGQVLADDFLPKFAAELQRTFGDQVPAAAQSTQAELNRLKTAWFELKVEMADSAPIELGLKTLASGVELAADHTGAMTAALGVMTATTVISNIDKLALAVRNLAIMSSLGKAGLYGLAAGAVLIGGDWLLRKFSGYDEAMAREKESEARYQEAMKRRTATSDKTLGAPKGWDESLKKELDKAIEIDKKYQAERLKLFRDTAKNILEIEKQNVKDRLDAEQGALDKLKTMYDEKLQMVNNFKDTMKGILAGWAEQDKASAEASRGFETPEARQRRLAGELQSKESEILGSWSMDPSEKVKALNDLDAQYKSLFRAVEDGTDIIISQEEADRNYMDAQRRLRDEINGVAEGMQKEDDALVSLAEQMNRAEGTIAGLNQRISELDRLINALPESKTIDIKLNVQGMNSLAQVAGAMGYQNFGDYYTANGKTYWSDGRLADEGTGFALPRASGGPVTPFGTYLVGERGPELIRMGSQGGSVIPNNQLGGITINGGINISLPNVTNQSTADDLARNLVPALRRYMGRLG
jgi:tape measure domain-containing protein